MPVDTREKLRSLADDLGSQAAVARLLGVSRSRVSRWLGDERPDADNRLAIASLEFTIGRLLEVFPAEVALEWLQGVNAHLGNRTPMFLLRRGRPFEVLAAIEAEETGAYA